MLRISNRSAWPALGVVAIAATALTACGGSANSSSAAAGTTSASVTASAGGSGGSAGSNASQEAAAAKERIASLLSPPTKINQSVPLTGKIPTDKPWVIITCELPGCQNIDAGAQEAAKAAGLPVKMLSYKTTDGATLTSAMKQALDYHPIAVSPIGFSQAVWDSLQPKYKAAGVFITPLAVGDMKTSDVVTEGSASQLDYSKSGANMADFVISDSNAQANILVMDLPAFAVLKAWGDGFKSEISQHCSACKVTPLDLTPAQLANNGVVPAIISALQKNKDVTYLASSDAAFMGGLPAALKAAGIKNLKIVGGSPDVNNLQAVADGTETAMTGNADHQYGWTGLDIVARHALGMQVPPGDGGRVEMIITKDNVGTPSKDGLQAPADFQDQYKKLWGLS